LATAAGAGVFTVLLVEDDADHAELVSRSLAENMRSCRIIHVSDGQAALDCVFRRGEWEEQEGPPNLILLDLRLPRVDGLSVLQEIKAAPELRHIPTVVLTSSAAERDVAQAYGRHANSYLVKPLDLGTFERLMTDLGLYWVTWNHRPAR
jgi:CheY-like chemotaxis protein